MVKELFRILQTPWYVKGSSQFFLAKIALAYTPHNDTQILLILLSVCAATALEFCGIQEKFDATVWSRMEKQIHLASVTLML